MRDGTSAGIPAIARGAIRAFFLYDVADTIDLSGVPSALGSLTSPAPLQVRPQTAPSFIQFASPPLVVARSPKFATKIFDYGVVSLAFAETFEGEWADFVAAARRLRRDETLVSASREELDRILEDLRSVLDDPHTPLMEDYFVFEVERFAQPMAAKDLAETHRAELARLVTSEERPLATREVDDVFRVSFSYYEDDLAVIEWESAFVYDANPGPVADILEFANSQLLELRTYDALLDADLDRIYKFKPRAEELRFLIVDVRELLDRSGNALKFIGDAYFARLYRGASSRLGLDEWQRQIDAKLRTVSETYRFIQDRAQHSRDTLLEVIIILLIVIEVVVGILALHR